MIGNSVSFIDLAAFVYCANLTQVNFLGNAPGVIPNLFLGDINVTVYYLPGTLGWGPTLGGRPTALWSLPYPLILSKSPGFGVQNNEFGFIISWAYNPSVVVEASTNLANPFWAPIKTNTLTDGSAYFNDPDWTQYRARFYRLSAP